MSETNNSTEGEMRQLEVDECRAAIAFLLHELEECCPSVLKRLNDGELTLPQAIQEANICAPADSWEDEAPVNGPWVMTKAE